MNPIFPVVIAAVLAACPALAVAQAQSQTEKIVTRTFAGKPVRLVIPAGFCLIDRDSPSGRRFYQLQEELNRGTNVVGAIFADCKEWAQRQATPSYRIRRYGAYLFQLTGGKEVLFPSQVTREAYLREISRLESDRTSLGSETSKDELSRKLANGLATATVETASSVERLNLGLIALNDYAAFHGISMTVKYSPESPRISTVVAMTSLDNGVPASINLTADYDPKDVFKRLLNQQERNAQRLVEENR